MPLRRLPALACVVLLATACRKETAPDGPDAVKAPAPAAPAAPVAAVPEGPAVSEADVSAVLAEMTQALSKFSFEKQRLPASIDELVAAGYLGAKPAAPGGKHFVIEPKTTQVVVSR